MNLYWYGVLTTGNVERVAGLLNQLLDGKYYTAISALPDESRDCRMSVRTSQKLSPEGTRDRKAISWSVDDGRAHLTIHDTYGLWCLDSKLEGDNARNDNFQNPYFVFEGNQVTIRHRAPIGNLLVWTFAVEDHAE